MEVQHTIANSVSLSGKGLFSSADVKLTLRPAPADHGVVFIRIDQNSTPIPALVGNVVKRARRTAIRSGDASVETTEHCMSALAGLGIDNVRIEIEGPELPALDGSAQPYIDAINAAGGVIATDEPRTTLVISEPVMLRQDDAMVAAMPSSEPGMHIVYDLDYGPNNPIGRQLQTFNLGTGDYIKDIASARTFCLEEEARMLRAAGLGTHLSPADMLVFGPQGPIGGNKLRFDNEPVRHKILDLIGDLYLLGAPIQGKIIAHKSGHWLNQRLAKELTKQLRHKSQQEMLLHRNVIDVRRLMRVLPHRYPMLLVDRVIEIDSDRRAVGVKNVSINEPFFQGHFPGTPMMPGVLIVEAMAQLSGVLIGQKLENMGRLAILLSLDRVKLRRPVTPGDQLVLEAEAVKVRSRIAHMRCRAYVAEELAAEAEVKFMIIDDEKETRDF